MCNTSWLSQTSCLSPECLSMLPGLYLSEVNNCSHIWRTRAGKHIKATSKTSHVLPCPMHSRRQHLMMCTCMCALMSAEESIAINYHPYFMYPMHFCLYGNMLVTMLHYVAWLLACRLIARSFKAQHQLLCGTDLGELRH